jgi:predicted AlkP superfamily pyrophosphatase or phosphodiesterase
MSRVRTRVLGALSAAGLVAGIVAAQPAAAEGGATRHVLLLSVDGLHQTDLAWYVKHHPGSALAELVGRGVEFTNAQTPFPSDSFPGMVGQVTGGNPSSTGVYYDDSYNHALLPAGNKPAVRIKEEL